VKRSARALALLLAAAAVALTVAMLGAPTTERHRLYVFGTLAELELRGAEAAAAATAIARRFALRGREWHPWQDSDLTRLNRALERGEAGVPVASIRALIQRARPLVHESGRRFDPGAGRLIARWGFHTDEWPARGAPPSTGELIQWRDRPQSLLALELRGEVVHGPAYGLALDFNAMAEGAVIEEATALLRTHGVRDALLNLGGDVYALGNAGRRPWRVALADGEGGVLGSVALGDGEGVFVSGSYAKYRRDGAVRRAHVIDPRDGLPVQHTRLAAVLHTDPVRTDAAATALLVAGTHEWREVLAGMGLGCALLIDAVGALHITSAMRARLLLSRMFEVTVEVDAGTACVATPAPAHD
jgi:thiamine biosynthesis lipoprotein